MHAFFREEIGQIAPRPYHVVVNGWYFYSINFISGGALLRSFPTMLVKAHSLASQHRRDHSADRSLQLSDLRAEVARGPAAALPSVGRRCRTQRRDTARRRPPGPDRRAGRARRRVLRWDRGVERCRIQDGDEPRAVLPAPPRSRSRRQPSAAPVRVRTAGRTAAAARHGVARLVARSTAASRRSATNQAERHGRVVEARQAAEAEAFAALASSPRRLRTFRRVLADAQHLVPIREEQTEELTIAWPVLRRAVLRIGEALADAWSDRRARRRLLPHAQRGARGTRRRTAGASRRRARAAVPACGAGAPRAPAPGRPREPDDPAGLGQLPGTHRRPSVGRRARVRRSGVAGSRHRDRSGDPRARTSSTSCGRARSSWHPSRHRPGRRSSPGRPRSSPTLGARHRTPRSSRASTASRPSSDAVDATARLQTGMRVTVDGSTGNVEPERAQTRG